MIPTDPLLRQVGRLWAAYQARDWALARALVSPEAVCQWLVTGERFDGPMAIVRVNAEYPEGWQLHLLELHRLGPDRVLSVLRVDQGGQSFWCHSHARVGCDGIEALDEYWADGAEPPAWRGALARRTAPDARPGLPLAPPLWA